MGVTCLAFFVGFMMNFVLNLFTLHVTNTFCWDPCVFFTNHFFGGLKHCYKPFFLLRLCVYTTPYYPPNQVAMDYQMVPVNEYDEKKEEQRKLIAGRGRAWLKRGHDDGGSWRPRKKQRVSAFQWAQNLEQSLQYSSQGKISLSQLVVAKNPDARGPALQWKSGSLCCDQGTDDVCASFWLRGPGRANLDFIWDWSHLGANALEGATGDAGLKPLAKLMDMAYNAKFGPWDEGRRFSEVRDVLTHHLETMTHEDCVLWAHHLPKMLRDRGELGRLMEPNISAICWEEFREHVPWRCRGSPASNTRFMGSLRAAKSDDPFFHSNAFGYLLACLECDLLHGAKFQDVFVRKVTLKATGCGASSASTDPVGMRGEAMMSEAQIRACCKNLLVVACMLYNESSNQDFQRIRVKGGEPLLQWHTYHNKTLRDLDNTVKWQLEMVTGGFEGLYKDTLYTLCNPFDLDAIGFTLFTSPMQGKAWLMQGSKDQQELTMDAEDQKAEVFAIYTTRLVSHHARRSAWLARGWPASAIRVLSPELRDATAKQLERDERLFQQVRASPLPADVEVAKRSCFQHVPVQQLFGVFCEMGGATQSFQDWVRQKGRKIAATQAVEDGFHECKDVGSKCLSKEALPRTCYERLNQSAVLTERHHYEMVSTKGIPLQRNARVSEECFRGTASLNSKPDKFVLAEDVNLRDIVGHQKASWYSPAIKDMFTQFHDLEMLDYLERRGQLHLKENAWLGELLNCKSLLIRRKVDPPSNLDWKLAIGSFGGTASRVWPMNEIDSKVFLKPTRIKMTSYSFNQQSRVMDIHENMHSNTNSNILKNTLFVDAFQLSFSTTRSKLFTLLSVRNCLRF